MFAFALPLQSEPLCLLTRCQLPGRLRHRTILRPLSVITAEPFREGLGAMLRVTFLCSLTPGIGRKCDKEDQETGGRILIFNLTRCSRVWPACTHLHPMMKTPHTHPSAAASALGEMISHFSHRKHWHTSLSLQGLHWRCPLTNNPFTEHTYDACACGRTHTRIRECSAPLPHSYAETHDRVHTGGVITGMLITELCSCGAQQT